MCKQSRKANDEKAPEIGCVCWEGNTNSNALALVEQTQTDTPNPAVLLPSNPNFSLQQPVNLSQNLPIKMNFTPSYLQALRDCCRDDTAFETLMQILRQSGEEFEQGISPRISNTSENLPATLLPHSIEKRLNEWKFQKMAANIPGMLFQALHRKNGDRSLLWASAACRCLFELEPKVAQQDISQFWRLIHPDDRESYEASVASAASQLQPWHWEGRVITASGQLKWFQCAANPELQENGDILWDGLLMDITERKQAEESLQVSEEKFSKAFRSSPDAIAISTLNQGIFIDVNENFLQTSGYTRDEVIGHSSKDLNIWVNPQDRLNLQQQLIAQGSVQNLECEFRIKSGNILVALVSAEVIKIRGELFMLAVITDITERKRAEAQLKAAAERDRLLGEMALRIRNSLNLNEILNTTVTEVRDFLKADRVFIHLNENLNSRVVAESVSPHFPAIIGRGIANKAELVEMKTLFAKNRLRVIEDVNLIPQSSLLADYYKTYQIQASLAVAIIINDQIFGLLVANQCSSPRSWQSFEIDLLEKLATQVAIAVQQAQLYQQVQSLIENLEQQVAQRTEQLQQKCRELQELHQVKNVVLNTVSHDLRTSVMGTVMVLKNLLKKPGETLALSRPLLERMIQGHEQQLCQINTLLETYFGEEKSLILERKPLPLPALMKETLDLLSPLLNHNQAQVKNLLSSHLPRVNGDSKQLGRMFEILFTHILKQNPPGLELTLTAKIQGQMLRLTIQHHGKGMSHLECDRYFDLYVRNPQDCCSTSIGLKLYLCRQIIRAHQGEIGVMSSPRIGSTFWLTLPLAENDSVQING